MLKLGINSSGDSSSRQKANIQKCDHFEQQYIHLHCTESERKAVLSCVYDHSSVKANQNLLFHLLHAGDIPSCEESGDGNKLISFSLSLFLFSVGVKDMFSCLGGSTSSSFSELVILEGDIPAKENKGKVKSSRENKVCL